MKTSIGDRIIIMIRLFSVLLIVLPVFCFLLLILFTSGFFLAIMEGLLFMISREKNTIDSELIMDGSITPAMHYAEAILEIINIR